MLRSADNDASMYWLKHARVYLSSGERWNLIADDVTDRSN